MKRTELIAAVLAIASAATPSHAATAATLLVHYRTSVTCDAVLACELHLTQLECVERDQGPACVADPATIALQGVVDTNGVCVLVPPPLRLFQPPDTLVVHTQALGTMTFEVRAVSSVAGTVALAGHAEFPLGVATMTGAGLAQSRLFPPTGPCEFTGGGIRTVVVGAGV